MGLQILVFSMKPILNLGHYNTEIEKIEDSKRIPKLISDYNNSMGGVDGVDQHQT